MYTGADTWEVVKGSKTSVQEYLIPLITDQIRLE